MSFVAQWLGEAPAGTTQPPIHKSGRLLGHFHGMQKDSLGLFMQIMHQTGDVARVRFGPTYTYFTYDPEHVYQVLIKDASKYQKATRGYRKLKLLLGMGLVTSEGDFWKRQRKIAQPGFRRERIAGFVESMSEATEALCESWEGIAAKRGQTDVAQAMMATTLRIAGETLFSADISKDTNEFGKALSYSLEHFNSIVSTPIPNPEKWPTRANRRFWEAGKVLNRVVHEIIEQRRQSGEDHGDLLSMLMLARDEDTGEGMSDQQLRDEVFTMLSAGHETTANALTWTLYLLSQHPEVAERVAQENEEVFGDRRPTAADLRKLTYTEQVLNESLRLYPPIWALGRRAGEDLKLGEYDIPKGAFVYFCQYAMHRHPKYWEEPESFDPERFGKERFEAFKQYPHWRTLYYPFSRGQRQCIGDHFAIMESLAVLSILVRRFRFELAPGTVVTPEPTLTLRPRGGLSMILRPR